jgi:hypothetical protein
VETFEQSSLQMLIFDACSHVRIAFFQFLLGLLAEHKGFHDHFLKLHQGGTSVHFVVEAHVGTSCLLVD